MTALSYGRPRLGLWIGISAGVTALLAVIAVGAVAVAGQMLNTVRVTVPGEAMEPTLIGGSTISLTKVTPGTYRPQRGDIVSFAPPDRWDSRGGISVLRVVALPDDVLSCIGRRVTVNLQGSAAAYDRAGCGPVFATTVRIPADRLWLMGDNRANAYDSGSVYATTSDVNAATVGLDAVTGVIRHDR